MSKLREQLQHDYSARAKDMAAISLLESTFEDLGILDLDMYVNYSTFRYDGGDFTQKPCVTLEPRHVQGLRADFSTVVDTTPTLGDAAKQLLPIVGRWQKSFDEKQNMIQLIAEYRGVRIILKDTPPSTCTVEKIEEEVEVPEKVIAAHTEKKVRYVLKGECDPLMSREQVADATGVPA